MADVSHDRAERHCADDQEQHAEPETRAAVLAEEPRRPERRAEDSTVGALLRRDERTGRNHVERRGQRRLECEQRDRRSRAEPGATLRADGRPLRKTLAGWHDLDRNRPDVPAYAVANRDNADGVSARRERVAAEAAGEPHAIQAAVDANPFAADDCTLLVTHDELDLAALLQPQHERRAMPPPTAGRKAHAAGADAARCRDRSADDGRSGDPADDRSGRRLRSRRRPAE